MAFHFACKHGLDVMRAVLLRSGTDQTMKSPSPRRSLEVYDRLRHAIVTGEIRPNEPLIEADLAAELGVSRTPVRESLQRLAAAGLIVPRKRGWSVREYRPEEVRQRSEIRAGLEGYAAFLAASRASEEELGGINEIHRLRLALVATDETARVKTNRAFHDAVIAAAHNPALAEAIDGTGQFYFNAPVARRTTAEEMRQGNAEHQLIVDALNARNAEAAEAAMRAHIQRTLSVFLRVIAAMP
jgi:DNA-binding GntR family transcriptional regulator